MSASRDRRRFTIEDAFEEETDDAIRVYGSTTERSPLKPKIRTNIPEDSIVVRIDDPASRQSPRSAVPMKSPDDVSYISYFFARLHIWHYYNFLHFIINVLQFLFTHFYKCLIYDTFTYIAHFLCVFMALSCPKRERPYIAP